jgi:hypothetical protein
MCILRILLVVALGHCREGCGALLRPQIGTYLGEDGTVRTDDIFRCSAEETKEGKPPRSGPAPNGAGPLPARAMRLAARELKFYKAPGDRTASLSISGRIAVHGSNSGMSGRAARTDR